MWLITTCFFLCGLFFLFFQKQEPLLVRVFSTKKNVSLPLGCHNTSRRQEVSEQAGMFINRVASGYRGSREEVSPNTHTVPWCLAVMADAVSSAG